jgi:hypothetical protein
MSIGNHDHDYDDREATYQRTEVQSLRFTAGLGEGNQNGSNQSSFSEEVVGPDGLDRDLVAELVLARVMLFGAINDQDSTTNQTPGSFRGRAGLGINTGRGDYPIFPDATSVDQADADAADGIAVGLVSDDPGVIYFADGQVSAEFASSGDGISGGADYFVDSELIEYSGEHGVLGVGPVVDATDDIQAEMQVNHQALGAVSQLRLHAMLWYRVWEVSDARPQFGLPEPHGHHHS